MTLEAIAVPAWQRLRPTRITSSNTTMSGWRGGAVGVLVLICVWWLISELLFSDTGSVPAPTLVARELIKDAASGVYWNAVLQTSTSAAIGYGSGIAIALTLALVVIMMPISHNLITQIAVVCACIPSTAIAPLVTLMTPAGSRATPVFLAGLFVIFPMTIGGLLGLKVATPHQLELIRAYGGSRWTELIKVRLVAALPSFIAALQIAAPAAVLGAVLGEYFMIGVDSGLGILLLAAQATVATVRLWAIALICAGTAGLAYAVIGQIGRFVTPWSTGGATAEKWL